MSRTRSFTRLIGVILAGLVVVALAAALFVQPYGKRRVAESAPTFEQVIGPVDLASHLPAAIPEAENAAVWLQRGAEAFVRSQADNELVNALLAHDHPPASWSEEERASIALHLGSNADALRLMRRSLDHPRASHVGSQAADPKRLLPFIRAGRAIWANARLAMIASPPDWHQVIDDAALLGRLAGSLEDEPTAIHVLVGIALEKFQLALMRDALLAGADAPTLTRLRELAVATDPVAAMARALASETAAGLALVEDRLPEDHYLAGLQDEQRGLAGALRHSLTGHLAVAETMDLIVALHSRADEPLATLENDIPSLSTMVPDAETLRRNLIHLHGRAYAMRRQRALAMAATKMRVARLETGTYPGIATGSAQPPPIVATALEGGGLRLELEGGADYWPVVAQFEPGGSLLAWELPG